MATATTVPTPSRTTRRSRGPVVAVAAGVIALGLGGYWAYDYFSSTTHQVTTEITAPTSTLAIVNNSGDVRVVGTDATTIRITRTEVSSSTKANTTIQQDGETLRVTGTCDGWGFASCHVDLVIQVPRAVAVDIHNGSGDVHATGTTVTTIHTGSGDTDVNQPTGAARISTGSGNVTVTDASSTVWTKVGSGDVRITTLGATPMTAETGSGDITVQVPHSGGPYDVRSQTGSGDTTVGVERADAGTTLEVTTGSGDITVNGR